MLKGFWFGHCFICEMKRKRNLALISNLNVLLTRINTFSGFRNNTAFHLWSLALFCHISPLGVFSGGSRTLLPLPSPRLSSLGFGLSRFRPARAGGCREQRSHPSSRSHRGHRCLPGIHPAGCTSGRCSPPLLALPSRGPDQRPDSLHPVASCFCQQKQAVKLQP